MVDRESVQDTETMPVRPGMLSRRVREAMTTADRPRQRRRIGGPSRFCSCTASSTCKSLGRAGYPGCPYRKSGAKCVNCACFARCANKSDRPSVLNFGSPPRGSLRNFFAAPTAHPPTEPTEDAMAANAVTADASNDARDDPMPSSTTPSTPVDPAVADEPPPTPDQPTLPPTPPAPGTQPSQEDDEETPPRSRCGQQSTC